MTSYWLPCSPISPNVQGWRGSAIFLLQLFSFLIKTKVVQNVNRMSESQKDMSKDRLTDRQKDRTTFQLRCQNKSCSECQPDVRKTDKQEDRQRAEQTDRMTLWQNNRAAKEPDLVF